MKCEKCDGELANSGVMISGNSKYIVWKCKGCDHEKMECQGLI